MSEDTSRHGPDDADVDSVASDHDTLTTNPGDQVPATQNARGDGAYGTATPTNDVTSEGIRR
ncbi:hypothetical protein [Haloarchaeobius sp. HRN-SO-5]|uniref:hypothetical protein n=1 Tax=Haloarchaeobius sp. HRN-SO-5 TaxID=3446118 RepID=UPI003EBC5F27